MKQDVIEHYEKIGDVFTDRSNPYCISRYECYLKAVIRPEDAVLEIGYGTGLLLSKMSGRRRVGCDLSPKLLSQLNPEGITLLKADAENLPFKEAEFDVVYSVNLLEHVTDAELAITESLRVLRPGGRLVAITPNGDWGWLLEVADRLNLKVPEGPHRFITTAQFKKYFGAQAERIPSLRIETMCKFAILPSGPEFLIRFFERCERLCPRMGFFQLIVIRK